MAFLQIEHRVTGVKEMVTLAEAEIMTQIDRTEIEWALEEWGVCEGDEYIITDTRTDEEILAAG